VIESGGEEKSEAIWRKVKVERKEGKKEGRKVVSQHL
jgi:hypothetical protein